jgi:integrase
VFGDETDKQVRSVKRAWQTAVLKAHGHTLTWTWKKGKTKKGSGSLSPESRAAYQAIDIHLHDLRHEGGSRLLEAGWPLHEVQQMLGHANIEQTSTYLYATLRGLHRSMRALTGPARPQRAALARRPKPPQLAIRLQAHPPAPLLPLARMRPPLTLSCW